MFTNTSKHLQFLSSKSGFLNLSPFHQLESHSSTGPFPRPLSLRSPASSRSPGSTCQQWGARRASVARSHWTSPCTEDGDTPEVNSHRPGSFLVPWKMVFLYQPGVFRFHGIVFQGVGFGSFSVGWMVCGGGPGMSRLRCLFIGVEGKKMEAVCIHFTFLQ